MSLEQVEQIADAIAAVAGMSEKAPTPQLQDGPNLWAPLS